MTELDNTSDAIHKYNRTSQKVLYKQVLHLHYDLTIWNHHRDPSKQCFEVFRQFLTSCVSWIHRDEDPSTLIQPHYATVCESESFPLLSYGSQDAMNLHPSLDQNLHQLVLGCIRSDSKQIDYLTCCAHTDKTSRLMRLNSSKQPHSPDWASPL